MDDVCCIVLLSVLLYLFRGNTFNETDIARFIGSKNPNWTIFTISRTIERRRKCIYNLLKRKQKFQKQNSLLIKRHKEQLLQWTMCKAIDATKEEKEGGGEMFYSLARRNLIHTRCFSSLLLQFTKRNGKISMIKRIYDLGKQVQSSLGEK